MKTTIYVIITFGLVFNFTLWLLGRCFDQNHKYYLDFSGVETQILLQNPQIEPFQASGGVFGKASWYDYNLKGYPNYSQTHYTCASRDFEKGTYLEVSHKDKSVICRVNDWVENPDVIIDLSSITFSALAPLKLGIIDVKIKQIIIIN